MPDDRPDPGTNGGASLQLSVAMANYNHAHLIAEALEAILGQSAKPMEVVVVDDGSTDNSVEVIEQVATRDPTVQLLRNESNQGVFLTSGRAFSNTTGDCVYFAAADDRVLPGFFEKSLAMLARHPETGLCFSLRQLIDEDGDVMPGHVPWGPCADRCYLPPEEVRRILLRRGLFVVGGNTIYRREAVSRYLPWRAELGAFADGFVEHSVALERGVCFIPEVLAQKRMVLTQERFGVRGQFDPKHALGVADHAIRLMETEYGHLWPKALAKQYRGMTTRKLGSLIAWLLWSNNQDVLARLGLLNARRPFALSGPFLAALKVWMRVMESGLRTYVKAAYRPTLRRLLDKVGEAARRRVHIE